MESVQNGRKGGATRVTKYGVRKNLPVLNDTNLKKKKSNNKSAKPTAPKYMKAFPPTACWEILKLNYADLFSQKFIFSKCTCSNCSRRIYNICPHET